MIEWDKESILCWNNYKSILLDERKLATTLPKNPKIVIFLSKCFDK